MALGGSLAGVARVILRVDDTQYNRDLTRAHTNFRHTTGEMEKDASRVERGLLAGSGAAEHFGRSIAFASTAFLGAAGFSQAIRSSISAAEDFGKATRGLDAQLRANNESVSAAGPLIANVDARMAAFGHTASETNTALARLTRATGDVTKASQLMTLAADLAAAKNISLEQAALLVGKVVTGNVSALNRYGIFVAKGTSVTDALTIAQQKLAGQAAASVTPMERLHAGVTNLEAGIGEALLPTINNVATALNKWIGNTKNQERVTKDVTEVVHVAKDVFSGIAGVIKHVDDVTGSFKETLKLLLALKVASVVTGWVASFDALIGAEAAGAAGTGLAGAAGSSSLLLKRLTALKSIGLITIDVELAMHAKGISDWIREHVPGLKTIHDWTTHIPGNNFDPLDPFKKNAPPPLTNNGVAPAGTIGAGSALSRLTGTQRGVSGPVTAGVKAIEQATGGRVNDDFATSGHAPSSYHYKGEAIDFAVSTPVWNKLYANRAMFAELFGPTALPGGGLYHFGVQFYDAKLQAEHQNHIHVAYTGGPKAIDRALNGGGGSPISNTRNAPGGDTYIASPKSQKPDPTAMPGGLSLQFENAIGAHNAKQQITVLQEFIKILDHRKALAKTAASKGDIQREINSVNDQIRGLRPTPKGATAAKPGAFGGPIDALGRFVGNLSAGFGAGFDSSGNAIADFQALSSGRKIGQQQLPGGLGSVKILLPIPVVTEQNWQSVIGELTSALKKATTRRNALTRALAKANRARHKNPTLIRNIKADIGAIDSEIETLRGDLGDAYSSLADLRQANEQAASDASAGVSGGSDSGGGGGFTEDPAQQRADYLGGLVDLPVGLRLSAAYAGLGGGTNTAGAKEATQNELNYVLQSEKTLEGMQQDKDVQEALIQVLGERVSLEQQLVGLTKQQNDQTATENSQLISYMQARKQLLGYADTVIGKTLGGSVINLTNYFPTVPQDAHLYSQNLAFELQAIT